jgi:hypothetical protein
LNNDSQEQRFDMGGVGHSWVVLPGERAHH